MAFLAAFAVYWFTLCPTIWVGDSGELVTAAFGLGIPHPTGYPLWLLLAKLASVVLPFGSVAWRVNLFCALCAAGAAQFVAATLRQLGVRRSVAVAGALAFAFLAPVWGEATVARTYSLAALFSAALLWCVARWSNAVKRSRPAGRWLLLHQLLLGFGLANHLMVIAHAPAALAWLGGSWRAAARQPRFLGVLLLSLLAPLPGLALYLYLPLRAAADPTLEYHPVVERAGQAGFGALDEPDALRAYLTREFHHTRRWAQSTADLVTIAGHHGKELVREVTPLGALLALLGLLTLARTGRRSWLLALLLLWVGNLVPLALHGAWWDIFLYSRYMTTAFVAAALLMGLGLEALLEALERRVAWLARPACALPIAAALPALLFALNYPSCNRRDAWLAEDFAGALLAELPRDAQVLSGSDAPLYPMFHARYVEGVRPDVDLVNPSQLDGEAELLIQWRAQRQGVAPARPASRPAFTPDFSFGGKFEGLLGQRQGLHYALHAPSEPPPPRGPYAPPAMRGLDRDDEPDPFARSVIAWIEASLADAAAVRGQLDVTRRRLDRVARLAAPRPWGNVLGVMTLFTVVEARAATGASGMETFADLELARRLVVAALAAGDPREAEVRQLMTEIGRRHFSEAKRLKQSSPAHGFIHFGRAAELWPEPTVRAAYLKGLLGAQRAGEARALFEQWRRDSPAAPELIELEALLGPN